MDKWIDDGTLRVFQQSNNPISNKSVSLMLAGIKFNDGLLVGNRLDFVPCRMRMSTP